VVPSKASAASCRQCCRQPALSGRRRQTRAVCCCCCCCNFSAVGRSPRTAGSMWTAAAGCCKRLLPLPRGIPPRAAACGSWCRKSRVARAFSVALGRDCGLLSALQPVVDVCPRRPRHVLGFCPQQRPYPLLGVYLSAARSPQRARPTPQNLPMFLHSTTRSCRSASLGAKFSRLLSACLVCCLLAPETLVVV
ncbi:unnamed protein product, partial [Ectocarpus sp. 12 AP-2014]